MPFIINPNDLIILIIFAKLIPYLSSIEPTGIANLMF